MKSIVSPKLRVAAFLVILNTGWVAAAWIWFDRATWLWIAPIALSINFLLLTYDFVLTFNQIKGDELKGQDPWGLLKSVHEICAKFQVAPVPQVFMVHTPAAQVFCYGRSGKRARLFITQGAVQLLTPQELAAALTYQALVIKSKLSLLNYWLGAALDLILRAGLGLERLLELIFGWSPRLSLWILRPWSWFLQRCLLSRRDFFRLDEATATGNGDSGENQDTSGETEEAPMKDPSREALARALWKMDAYAKTEPWEEAWVVAHMCMVSPLASQHTWTDLRLQPSLKARVQNLLGRYPL